MSRTLSILGIAITVVYLGILWFIFDGRLTEILLMPPNEIGDLLAGMFGPLAILWLILGFFQQGIELRQNTKALELQAEELKNSVEQQRELVGVSRRQFESHLESIRNEQEKQKLEAQPVFLFNTLRTPVKNKNFMVEMFVENIGANVTNVELLWGPHVSRGDIQDMTTFQRNRKVAMSWCYEIQAESSELWLSIEFSDRLGSRRKQVFDFLPGGSDGFFGAIMVNQR